MASSVRYLGTFMVNIRALATSIPTNEDSYFSNTDFIEGYQCMNFDGKSYFPIDSHLRWYWSFLCHCRLYKFEYGCEIEFKSFCENLWIFYPCQICYEEGVGLGKNKQLHELKESM